jgi:Zn-dependent protease/CBS domain-containing protein
MQRGIKLFRILGVDIFLDWSLLIIFFLISASLGVGLFPTWHPEWSAATSWLTAIAAAILFLVSVLTHEMSHALVGRAHGMRISRITLFIFGGMAHLEDEPRHWRIEFWMAIVGPITSLALGFLFIWAGNIAAGGIDMSAEDPEAMLSTLNPAATLLLWLGPVNIVLALFNLVPGFPLDGGRVMRAALWGINGDYQKATRWASSGGRIFGGLLIAAGLSMVLGVRLPFFGTGLGGLWLALIGWFLHNAAAMSYQQLLIERTLQGVKVADLMQKDVRTVAPSMPLQEFIDDCVMGSNQRAWPVTDHDELVGMVCLEDIRRQPREARAAMTLREAMKPVERLASVRPDEESMEAMKQISQHGVNQLPVIEGGRLRGLIRREDILRWLSLYGDLPSGRLSAPQA